MKGASVKGLKDQPKMTSIGGNGKKDKAKYLNENLCCSEEKKVGLDAFDNKHAIRKNAKRKMVQSG